ncbi:MAG: hypothetical protein COA78_37920 [Blastopirellula sp.]|nr:MAG: hypothetical protein COA78_37920 [Blastopirellula sp.]
MSLNEAQLMQQRDLHEAWLNEQAGITGTGIGIDSGGNICIKIFTNQMSNDTKERITSKLDGLVIDFEETGEFNAF